MKLHVTNKLTVSTAVDLTPIRKMLTYLTRTQDAYGNTEWKPIKLYRERRGESMITTGRGATHLIIQWAKDNGIPVTLTQDYAKSPKHEFTFQGTPRSYQAELINNIGESKSCLIKAATGSGKTATAIQMIAKRGTSTVVIVHSVDLINQWRDSIALFLGIPLKEVGQLGGGRCIIKPITVGTYHTIQKYLKELSSTGFVIADEAQYCSPGGGYAKCISGLNPTYLLGLSATPVTDGSPLPPLVYFGRQFKTMTRAELTSQGHLVDYRVHQDKFVAGLTGDYTKQLGVLCANEKRNRLILDRVNSAEINGGITLILCNRVDHINTLSASLSATGKAHSIVMGSITGKERDRIYSEMRSGVGNRILIGNLRICGAGLDIPELTTLILACPISSSGLLQQAVGRVLRPHPGKTLAHVIDIQDDGIFKGGSQTRRAFYKADLVRSM